MTGLSCQAGRENSSIFYPLCHLGQAALSVAGSSTLSGDHSTIYLTEGQKPAKLAAPVGGDETAQKEPSLITDGDAK